VCRTLLGTAFFLQKKALADCSTSARLKKIGKNTLYYSMTIKNVQINLFIKIKPHLQLKHPLRRTRVARIASFNLKRSNYTARDKNPSRKRFFEMFCFDFEQKKALYAMGTYKAS